MLRLAMFLIHAPTILKRTSEALGWPQLKSALSLDLYFMQQRAG